MRNTTKKGKERKLTNSFADWRPIVPPKELILASGRIGGSSVKRLRWLLNFAALDLGGLSRGQLSDLVWEIKAFLFPPNIENVIEEHSNDGYRVLFSVLEKEPAERGAISVEKFQAFVKTGIESVFFHGGWEFTYPRKTEKIGFLTWKEEGIGMMLQFDVTSANQAFEVAVFDMMKAEGGRLGLCANERCRKPFVTEKKNKGKFCSPRCSAYVRVTRFRERQ